MKIAIFYHCALMGNYKEVDKEIMDCLDKSGLLKRADMFVKNELKDVGLYEFPTLQMLEQFCLYNQDYYVLYLHTKGVSRNEPSIKDWRDCMLYWLVERWEECVDKLKDNDTVGISRVNTPYPHYQGNFWWAKADYLLKLGNIKDIEIPPNEINMTERHQAEFWLLGADGKHYSPYHHKINPYITKNPRSNYVNKKF